jgi:hypothetical protein
MIKMVVTAHSKRRAGRMRRPALAPIVAPEAPQPPSGALINVILEYADIQQDLGGDRCILRLSARRMRDPVIKSILGREARRLAEISILWDEQEGEIVRVRDDAARDEPSFEIQEESGELDSFELTEAALAYIARFAAKR